VLERRKLGLELDRWDLELERWNLERRDVERWSVERWSERQRWHGVRRQRRYDHWSLRLQEPESGVALV